MLFITYWELNENMPSAERLQAAQKLTSSGLFPPPGVNILRWDATPDLWGTITLEADTAEDAFRALDLWRVAGAGFFKLTKTAPCIPVEEVIPLEAEIQQQLASS